MKKDGILEGLREILKKERELSHRYLSQAQSVASPRVRETLTQIAWEKSSHVTRLAEILTKYGGEWDQIPASREGGEGRLTETQIPGILTRDYEEETRLCDLYQERIREIQDEGLKRMLMMIVEEKAVHRDQIRDLYRGFS